WGETVHAVIVLRNGAVATEREILDWCIDRIAGYKRPRSRTATGKIQHRVLRDRISAPGWTGHRVASSVGVPGKARRGGKGGSSLAPGSRGSGSSAKGRRRHRRRGLNRCHGLARGCRRLFGELLGCGQGRRQLG